MILPSDHGSFGVAQPVDQLRMGFVGTRGLGTEVTLDILSNTMPARRSNFGLAPCCKDEPQGATALAKEKPTAIDPTSVSAPLCDVRSVLCSVFRIWYGICYSIGGPEPS